MNNDDEDFVLVDSESDDFLLVDYKDTWRDAYNKLPLNISFSEFQQKVIQKPCGWIRWTWDMYGYASTAYTVFQYRNEIWMIVKFIMV